MKRKKIKGHTRHCGNKRKFEDFESADKAARFGGKWNFMQAYQCRKCRKFHYGHA